MNAALSPARVHPRVRLLNIGIDALTMSEFLDRFDHGLVVTPNADHMILLQEDPALLEAYEGADYVVVDSQILFWTLKALGRPVPEKLSGSDILPAYCRHHATDTGKRLFILGGRPGVASQAMANINKRAGRSLVIGAHAPSMGFGNDPQESEAVIRLILASGANVIVAGLGTPKQEVWLHRHRHRFPADTSFLAVGAAIDFSAGTAVRAPAWVSRVGLEWAFRLVREPGRLWRRYLVRDPKFFWLILTDLVKRPR